MDDKIQDIWNKHIGVQEQLLRARAVPTPIVPSSTRIVGEKLLMTVDERNQTDRMLMEIANTYSLSKEDLNFSNGYFYVDTNISNQVDFATKQQLSEAAEHNFIKLGSRPIVDGIICQKNKSLVALLKNYHCDFSFDKKGRLQISINDLKRIQSILASQDVSIPDTASIIFRFTPTPLSFLSQLVPNIPWIHETTIAEDKKNNINCKSFITVENGYISDSLLQFLNGQIGLSLHNYTFTFFVNKDAISKYDAKTNNFGLPQINDDGCSFSFTTQIRKEKAVDDSNDLFEEQYDFNFKFTRFKRLFDRLFGKDNITYTSKFRYRYDINKFSNEFLIKENVSKTIEVDDKAYKRRKLVSILLCVSTVWLFAVIAFFYFESFTSKSPWTLFVWSVPASCLVLMGFNNYIKKRTYMFVFATIFIWTLLASFYLQFLSYNLWLIFIIGAPIQVALSVSTYVSPKAKKSNN